MLSARDDEERIWISGRVSDPHSRSYFCPVCREQVSYVSSHLRSGQERVIEHFRHGKSATHPVRSLNLARGDALAFILGSLSSQYEMEVSTDLVYNTTRGRIATDILAREHFADGSSIDTLIMVEDSNKTFNFNDHLALQKALSAQGIYLMTVLCAESSVSARGGTFYRNEFRKASGKIVKDLFKNELALYKQCGINTYYDKDGSQLLTVKFDEYVEIAPETIYGKRRDEHGRLVETGFVVAREGEKRTFELKKTPQVTREITDDFKFRRGNPGGRLLAIPRHPTIDDLFDRRNLASFRGDPSKVTEMSEMIGTMLSMSTDEERRRLTQKYGASALGGYVLV